MNRDLANNSAAIAGVTLPEQIKKYSSLKIIFWLIAILLGTLQALAKYFNLSSNDSIAYLDIGDAYMRGDWNVAINVCWSPLYSWILGLALFVLKPSPYWKVPVVRFIQLSALYLCFNFV